MALKTIWIAESMGYILSRDAKPSDLQVEINDTEYSAGRKFLDMQRRNPKYYTLLRPNDGDYDAIMSLIQSTEMASGDFVVLIPQFEKYTINGQVPFFLIWFSFLATQMFWISLTVIFNTKEEELLAFLRSRKQPKKSRFFSA